MVPIQKAIIQNSSYFFKYLGKTGKIRIKGENIRKIEFRLNLRIVSVFILHLTPVSYSSPVTAFFHLFIFNLL